MTRSDRRQFLKTGTLAAVAAMVPGIGCDQNDIQFKQMPAAPDMPDLDSENPDVGLPLPRITTNSRFYLQSIKGKNWDPKIKAEDWSISIDGLVDNPVPRLTLDEIVAMPMERQTMTLQCIGNWIGGPLVDNAEWGGTPFNNLLDMAKVRGESMKVKFESIDGYVTSIPLERARRDDVLLVWEMNGRQLPSKHGFPVRLINPGHYGQKMPKWITRIELIDDPAHLGHWESMPQNKPFKWSDDAFATVNSRIDAPLSLWDDVKDPDNGGVSRWFQTISGTAETEFAIHGIAMAGESVVERVEISTDLEGTRSNVRTWEDAHITSQSIPGQWLTWRYDWKLPASGRYEIIARATDLDDVRQPEFDVGPDLYDGRTGWHRVPVDVNRRDA